MDFRLQVSSVRVRGACFKGLIALWDVEGMEIGEHRLRNGQGHGEQPDRCSPEADLQRSFRCLDIHWFDNGLVSMRQKKTPGAEGDILINLKDVLIKNEHT